MSQNDPSHLPDLPETLPTQHTEERTDSVSDPIEDAGTKALSDALQSSFKFIKVLMFFLVAVFLCSGIFVVDPGEVAVVLRFGKPLGTGSDQIRQQGLHWGFPYPIDEIVRISIEESRSIDATNCWYQITPEMEISGAEPMALSQLQPGVDGYALSSDGNIIHVRAIAKYRIADPLRYRFHYLDVTNLLENALGNALLHAASRFTAERALYKEKDAFRDAVGLRFLQTIREENLGIELEPIEVRAVPPMFVKEAFNEVIGAEQVLSQTRNKAEGEALEITRKAIGEARAILSEGMTRSNRLVQLARADAHFFRDQLAHYEKNPRLFQERLLVETMSKVLTNVSDKWFLPASSGKVRQLRLQLNREPKLNTESETDSEENE